MSFHNFHTILADFGVAEIRLAAGAASPEGSRSRDQVGCWRSLPEDQIQGRGPSSRGTPHGKSTCERRGTGRSPGAWSPGFGPRGGCASTRLDHGLKVDFFNIGNGACQRHSHHFGGAIIRHHSVLSGQKLIKNQQLCSLRQPPGEIHEFSRQPKSASPDFLDFRFSNINFRRF